MTSTTTSTKPHPHDPHHARRWWVLIVLSVAQLAVILDATIVNVALPTAQRDLDFSDGSRQWVVTAYALAFGSLLPLGGRLTDLLGRKWTFVTGLLGFSLASAIGGAAGGIEVLIAARVGQGVFAALLAPAALALLAATFTDPRERNRAFAIFGGLSGAGGALGLLLGGILTEYLSWRWTMYVNIVLAVPAAAVAVGLLVSNVRQRPRLDIPGTVTASAGLFAIVFGFSRAETEGWGAGITITSLVAGLILLAAFVLIQQRVTHPLLPLRVVLDRNRGGSFLALALASLGLYGVFLFLTYFLQLNLAFSPVETGLAFLPMTVAMAGMAGIAQTALLPRTGPRPLVFAGLLLAAGGMALLAQIDTGSSYVSDLLPGLVVLAGGLGVTLATALNASTLGVATEDSGAAGAMANTSQQIGSAIGLALLSTLAADATADYLGSHGRTQEVLAEATVHGFSTGFWWTSAIFAGAALITGALVRPGVPVHDPDAAPAIGH
jgi:EmrB/QacA subfamily drug resistance transporter